jgi:hypothetical protein
MPVIGGRRIIMLLREPHEFLEDHLREPETAFVLFVQVALPLIAIRAVAVLGRSILFGSMFAGVVLAVGSLALLIGVWLGLALVLPAVARQFQVVVKDRDAFALVTFASVPMWLAGLFYLAPEESWFFSVWSRLLVFVVASYGVYILARGLMVLGVDKKALPGILTATAIAFVTLYLPVSLLLAFAAHLVLFVVGAG